ncbi:MAG: OmpA family protein [Eudoraea sp.]|nr:OmpA family protein [Eudoraea sp.]NNJ40727.1 OmpA family protein [Eudoraea sp.]
MRKATDIKNALIWILLFSVLSVSGQVKKSRADQLFYQYEYTRAISEYNKEKQDKPLTNQQLLNLADAYYKTGNYQYASDTYLDVFKTDTDMPATYFNKMLMAFGKNDNSERIKIFLNTRRTSLDPELLENAEINFDLMEKEGLEDLKFEIFNVQANSSKADFSPTFYKDQLLFASSRGHKDKPIYEPTGEAYMDIFTADLSPEGNTLNTKLFSGIQATPFHQATPFYVEELNLLFFIRSNVDNGEMVFDDAGKNTLAIGLVDGSGTFRYAFRDQSTSFYYPFFDSETEKLYFAADLEGGYGGTDLYYVYTNNGLIMSSPVNLGPRINSPGNEIAPFIFENSLYFSSDVFYGYGGMDVYKSELLQGDAYSLPVNLGKGINTDYDEFGFIIKNFEEEGLIGFFASNRSGGKGNDDLYGFKVAEKPGIKTFALKGRVVNEVTGVVVPEAQIKLLDSTGNVLKELYATDNGTYQLEIPWEPSVTLEVTQEKHSVYRASYDEAQMEDIQKGLFDVPIAFIEDLVEEKEDQTVIKLNKAYFRRGQSRITPEVALELDKAVDVIKKFPELQLRIEAHTDSRGGSATNFRLSQNRANAIKSYLEMQGVPTSNILYTIGYGEDKLINDCKSGVYCLDVFHKQNERHLIVVLNYNILY